LLRILKIAGASLVGLLLLAVGFAYWYDRVGQKADLSFDTSVAKPTYSGDHPRLLFDVAHHNFHTPTGRYRPYAELLRNDGYVIVENHLPFTAQVLDAAQVLVVANAMGPDDHEGRDAFSDDEKAAVTDWVQRGGALLLIADHVPFGGAASALSKQFGVEMYLAFARDDDDDKHAGWDNERLVFSRENGLLTDAPITRGRNQGERVCRVVTFTGQSLSVPAGATPILRMGNDAYDWRSRSDRRPARGHAQGVSLSPGKGRLVILGEAGVLSAQVDPLGFKMGMNYADSCDKQFGLNVMHWLSRALN
jgi:hypothetical protein